MIMVARSEHTIYVNYLTPEQTIPESLRKNPPCDHIWCLRIKVK